MWPLAVCKAQALPAVHRPHHLLTFMFCSGDLPISCDEGEGQLTPSNICQQDLSSVIEQGLMSWGPPLDADVNPRLNISEAYTNPQAFV